jgi:hypothetical protein
MAVVAKNRMVIVLEKMWGLGFQKLRLPKSRIIVHDCCLAETMTCPPSKNPWK